MDVRYDTIEGQATLDELGLQLMQLGARLDADDLGLSGSAGDIAGSALADFRSRVEMLVGDIVVAGRLTLDAVDAIHVRTGTVDQPLSGWPLTQQP